MRIKRIPKDQEHGRGVCHDCHNRAEFEITFGGLRPPLHLCLHDAKYLAGYLARRITEHEENRPIPKPRVDEDTRGNR
jgi:hypothetical protein